jgi:hypothetical protein
MLARSAPIPTPPSSMGRADIAPTAAFSVFRDLSDLDGGRGRITISYDNGSQRESVETYSESAPPARTPSFDPAVVASLVGLRGEALRTPLKGFVRPIMRTAESHPFPERVAQRRERRLGLHQRAFTPGAIRAEAGLLLGCSNPMTCQPRNTKRAGVRKPAIVGLRVACTKQLFEHSRLCSLKRDRPALREGSRKDDGEVV